MPGSLCDANVWIAAIFTTHLPWRSNCVDAVDTIGLEPFIEQMILMYWDIGRMITVRQKREGWAARVIPRLALDFKNELPEEKGISDTNLKQMVQFSREYPDLFSIGAPAVPQLPLPAYKDNGRSTIAEHLKNICETGELEQKSVCRDSRHTAEDGREYTTQFYNLDAIIAVGFRVNSTRTIQFRQWARARLGEYVVNGFIKDDERLRNLPGSGVPDSVCAEFAHTAARDCRVLSAMYPQIRGTLTRELKSG